ncbi:MAG: hypothetical protein QOG87_3282 [Actinomycetota bacterium]|jgi:hypothetical protein
MLPAVARRATVVELSDVRAAAGLMLAGAAVRATMSHPVGIPCPLRSLTGVPCPLCGMTTSVTAAVRLDIGEALATNPAGIIAVVAAIAVLVFRARPTVTLPVWLIPVGLALMWGFELHRFDVIRII